MRKKFDLREITTLSTDVFSKLSVVKQGFLICDCFHEIETKWSERPLRLQLVEQLLRFIQVTSTPHATHLGSISEGLKSTCDEDNLRAFITLVVPIERALGLSDDANPIVVDKLDRSSSVHASRSPKPLYIIADNLRSALNIGSIFRTCECLQVSHLFLCGYSATPENHKLLRSAMGTEDLVPWSWHANAKAAIDLVRERGFPIYALETIEKSPSIYEFDFPDGCGLLLGNERYGLSPELVEYCSASVKIPLFGLKNSLNVTSAFAIAASEIMRQQGCFKG